MGNSNILEVFIMKYCQRPVSGVGEYIYNNNIIFVVWGFSAVVGIYIFLNVLKRSS
jgi:hypothetical protein